MAELKKLPQVEGVTDPYQEGTVSQNGRIAYATWPTRWPWPT